MSFYYLNPNVWAPEEEASLLGVLVPEGTTEIADEGMYLGYLSRRLDWLIEQWMKDLEEAQEDVQRMLDKTVMQLSPVQHIPSITDNETGETLPITEWRQAWAETIVLHNGIIQEKLGLLGVDFPVSVITDEQEKESLLWMFNSDELAEPTLEEWLSSLTVHLRE